MAHLPQLFAFFFFLTAPLSLSAAELCRYEGTTNYAGHVDVTTRAESAGAQKTVDVVLRFEGRTMPFVHIHYLVEEITVWRDRQLQRLAQNYRYLVGSHIVRQQWDVFDREGDALRARRVEGKHREQFGKQRPGFARHWDPESFGAAWLDDFAGAPAERRPDLDLAPVAAGVRTPFALAFYWIRFLPPGPQRVPVFLPGFKTDKTMTVAIAQDASAQGVLAHTELHYVALSEAPPSMAAAQISADQHLEALRFSLHGSAGSGHGELHASGCGVTP